MFIDNPNISYPMPSGENILRRMKRGLMKFTNERKYIQALKPYRDLIRKKIINGNSTHTYQYFANIVAKDFGVDFRNFWMFLNNLVLNGKLDGVYIGK